MSMTRLLLVRHGETLWHADAVYRGRSEVPLSETGLRQACLLGRRLAGESPTALHTSPLTRARETARAIAEATGLFARVEPEAMILAQSIIAVPLVAGFTLAAVLGVDPQLGVQIKSLGATRWQVIWTILSEARVGVIIAIVAALGRIAAEVGAVMLVGGNIAGRTRVLTTAVVLETRKGNFELAIALGIILISLAFVINTLMLLLQRRVSG